MFHDYEVMCRRKKNIKHVHHVTGYYLELLHHYRHCQAKLASYHEDRDDLAIDHDTAAIQK